MPAFLTRRDVIAAGCGLLAAAHAQAGTEVSTLDQSLEVGGDAIRVRRYLAPGAVLRPAVLLLHGSKGLDANLPAYDRYARDLATAGMDALLFTYMRPDDITAIGGARDASARRMHYERSISRWVSVVHGLRRVAATDGRGSGQVGLCGFSLGGFIAVAAASQPQFAALSVYYAGLPAFTGETIGYLPPLLDIHGDQDHSVSLAEGERLVATAKRLGGVAELAVFHAEGHGFDLDLGNRDAAAARQRAVAFLSRWLTRRG